MIALYILNGLSFCFASYIMSGVLNEALKEGKIIKPAALTISGLAIGLYLFQNGGQLYILSVFAGYFIQSCQKSFVRKKKVESKKDRNPKVVKINP